MENAGYRLLGHLDRWLYLFRRVRAMIGAAHGLLQVAVANLFDMRFCPCAGRLGRDVIFQDSA